MDAINSIVAKTQAFHYELSLILVAVSSTVLGWFLIAGLRVWIKKSSNPHALAYLPILSPVLFYGFFSFLYHIGVISSTIGDCATLFIMNGIILRLSVKSKSTATVRLAINVKDSNEFTDVWLKDNDISVGDARHLIAKALNVQSSRVNIESGKGTFLKDISDNVALLLPLIESESANKDLFGFSTVPCYVTITEEMLSATKPRTASMSRVFPTLDTKSSSIKYGSNITIQGKIPNSANDAKAFCFSIINKFAAVAPSLTTLTMRASSHPAEMVSFVAWREDAPDTASMVSTFENSLAGQKIKNGESIVLENNGHFMSVSKGWYVSWASDKPRRSGAFVIEIIKKAPQSILGHGKEIIKEKVLQKEKEDSDVLRGGDIFRLKSVKFPLYELGVTSVRLKDDHFHVGLRKIEEESSNKSDWCLPLHLTAKMH
jgi:hypothetical protein